MQKCIFFLYFAYLQFVFSKYDLIVGAVFEGGRRTSTGVTIGGHWSLVVSIATYTCTVGVSFCTNYNSICLYG